MLLRRIFMTALVLGALAPGINAQLPGRYTRYAQALATLDSLQTAFPEVCRLDTMGYSTRDSLPMLRFKISDNVGIDEDEPAVFYCGGVHADEVLGVEVVMWFVKDFMNRYARQDRQVMNYVDSLEIYCVPFINPEGHTVVEGGNLVWRKDKCDNDSNGVFDIHDGVDNNRNYDLGWNIDQGLGALTPESLEYKGTAPFTQTENVAMAQFAWHYRPLVALDYHSPSYGRSEVAYYPWWWWPSDGGQGASPDEALMYDLCRQYCSRIVNDRGDSTYEARRALVDKGDYKTYFYGNFGTVAFSVEISDTTIQDSTVVDGICIRHLQSQYYLLGRALGPGITGVIRDSVTLEPLEAEVQVLERINPDINPRLSRPDFGRYRRVLTPGTYTLRFLKNGYRAKNVSGVNVTSGGPTVVDMLLPPINPRPVTPELVYPPPETTIYDLLPQFIWQAAMFAQRYQFEMYSDSLLSMPLYLDSTITDTAFVPDLQPNDTLIYWRVRAGNDYGWGQFSNVWRFIFHLASKAEEREPLPGMITLSQNYPNPFNGQTAIAFDIPAGADARLEIYDIGGRLVREFAGFSGGPQSITWDAKDSDGLVLESGLYLYRLKVGNRSLNRKMILLK